MREDVQRNFAFIIGSLQYNKGTNNGTEGS